MSEKLIKKLSSDQLAGYNREIYVFAQKIYSKDAAIDDCPFKLLLRPFYWFSHDPVFRDFYYSSTVVMPALTAYMMYAGKAENIPANEMEKARKRLDVLVQYLDDGKLRLNEQDNVIKQIALSPNVIQRCKEHPKIFSIHDMIQDQEEKLKKHEEEGLIALMRLSMIERLEHYRELYLKIVASQKEVLRILENSGHKVVSQVQDEIHRLHPIDQMKLLIAMSENREPKATFFRECSERTTYPQVKEFIAEITNY